jgi:RecB family endonuclease NucS
MRKRFLGVTFLASEYSTGKTHGGRIDMLAIDENDCPVIIEYKRSTNENVINQGWLERQVNDDALLRGRAKSGG